MQPRRIALTAHRFARLIAWLCAVLAWVAAGAPSHRRRRAPAIAKLRHAVACAILIVAATHVAPHGRRPPRRYGLHMIAKRPSLRVIGGAFLRRKLRPRGTLVAQAKHLMAALSNRHTLARQLARRRRAPFTRLAPILPRPGAPAPLSAIAAAPAIANSS
jgi:hypothetical protein